MDYTTSVFPVTFVDSELDKPHSPHDFYNYEDEAIYQLCQCSLILSLAPDLPNGSLITDQTLALTVTLDDSKLFDGCPVGLQLIGQTQEEEAVIAMTEIVDEALRAFKAKTNQR